MTSRRPTRPTPSARRRSRSSTRCARSAGTRRVRRMTRDARVAVADAGGAVCARAAHGRCPAARGPRHRGAAARRRAGRAQRCGQPRSGRWPTCPCRCASSAGTGAGWSHRELHAASHDLARAAEVVAAERLDPAADRILAERLQQRLEPARLGAGRDDLERLAHERHEVEPEGDRGGAQAETDVGLARGDRHGDVEMQLDLGPAHRGRVAPGLRDQAVHERAGPGAARALGDAGALERRGVRVVRRGCRRAR